MSKILTYRACPTRCGIWCNGSNKWNRICWSFKSHRPQKGQPPPSPYEERFAWLAKFEHSKSFSDVGSVSLHWHCLVSLIDLLKPAKQIWQGRLTPPFSHSDSQKKVNRCFVRKLRNQYVMSTNSPWHCHRALWLISLLFETQKISVYCHILKNAN